MTMIKITSKYCGSPHALTAPVNKYAMLMAETETVKLRRVVQNQRAGRTEVEKVCM